jgi:uncharacterized protein YrzB (UPF0473 family)
MNDKIVNDLGNEIKKKAKSREMYKIVFTDENGKDTEYEIILTFKSKENEKIYYVMTDNTRSSNNELNIMAYYVDYDETYDEPSDVNETFYPVVNDDELNMVMEVFNKVKETI